MLRRAWVSGASALPWEGGSEQHSKAGRHGKRWASKERQEALELLGCFGALFSLSQPATNSLHGELCSPSCKVNTCERTTGMCLLYVAKYSRLQRIKIPSGKTHGLK